MLQFMNFWFAAFLFAGFLIPKQDLYYPFEIFYYVMPYAYYVRSYMYEFFSVATFESCVPDESISSVCVESTDGLAVLGQLGQVFPVISTKSYTGTDILVLLCIGMFYKILYIVGVLYKTSKTVTIHSDADYYNEVTSKRPPEPEPTPRAAPPPPPPKAAMMPDEGPAEDQIEEMQFEGFSETMADPESTTNIQSKLSEDLSESYA